jgi:hypothetical protein
MSTEFKWVRVLWDYAPSESNELHLSQKQLIRVTEEHNPDWWEGIDLEGNRGLFPANHVETIHQEQLDTEETNLINSLFSTENSSDSMRNITMAFERSAITDVQHGQSSDPSCHSNDFPQIAKELGEPIMHSPLPIQYSPLLSTSSASSSPPLPPLPHIPPLPPPVDFPRDQSRRDVNLPDTPAPPSLPPRDWISKKDGDQTNMPSTIPIMSGTFYRRISMEKEGPVSTEESPRVLNIFLYRDSFLKIYQDDKVSDRFFLAHVCHLLICVLIIHA